jgi:hypothetical protein
MQGEDVSKLGTIAGDLEPLNPEPLTPNPEPKKKLYESRRQRSADHLAGAG